MIAIRTILLPTDGSECSGKAISYSLAFASQFNARVVGLHVIEQHWEDLTRHALGEIRLGLHQQARARREEEAREIVEVVAEAGTRMGVTVDTQIVTGTPVQQILRLAKELDVDLIIMGTHGRTGFSHFFLGSVAEKVVRQAPCPVLTVHPSERDFVTS